MNPQERIRALLVEARAICADADTNNNGILTDEQQTSYDEKMTAIDGLKAAIERQQALDATEAALTAAVPRLTTPDPVAAGPGAPAATPGLGVTPGEEDPMCGFVTAADFGRAVYAAENPGMALDPRLSIMASGAPVDPHLEVGTTEGFMVPPAMRAGIWELVLDEPDLLSILDIEATESNRVELIADPDTPWATTGVKARWRNEVAQMTPTKLTTEPRAAVLHELYAFVEASNDLLEDAPLLTSRLTNRSAEAISGEASEAVVVGTGVGQPFGFSNSGALVAVPKVGGQAADTIVAQNVADMYARMRPNGHRDGVWLINPNALPQLITMTLANQLVWTPPREGFVNAPGGFLFGKPVMLSQHSETLGDQGDIYYFSPKGYYAINKASGIRADTSIHLYFDRGATAFRWTFRFGGLPFLSAPIVPNKGADSQSHFIALAARA